MYADVNGDGRPDLLLQCGTAEKHREELQVLLNSNDSGYVVSKRYKLPIGASQLTIVDVDGDGSPDLVFTVCDPPETCSNSAHLHIVYNRQQKFCTGDAKLDHHCKANSDHFEADSKFDFAFDSDSHQIIDISKVSNSPSNENLVRRDAMSGLAVPLSFGDYDLDGFPDILFTLSKSVNNPLGGSRVVLLKNVPCTATTAGCNSALTQQGRRTFANSFERIEALSKAVNPIQAAFGDVFGNGRLGIFVNGYSNTQKPTVNFYLNDAFTDVYFVRAESLNGVCPAPCASRDAGSKARKPFGVNYVGATFRVSFTDSEGLIRVRHAAQLPQTSNRALQLPFAIFGLGRTNSFVDRFSAASTFSGKSNWHSQNHIIPNSDLVVIPPHADNSAWQFQVYIHPSAHLIWVAASLVVAMSILLVITGYFKVKEKREDEAEKKKRAHAINFDAM